SNRNVSLCLVARLALTEGFAAVQSARHSCPCRDASSFRCRCLMQPKLRYTPIVVFSCFVSFLKQECFLMFGSASRAHRRFCCRAVRSAFLPMSRCIVFPLPLPYATQTALHPDSGIQLFCFIPQTGMFPYVW